MTLRSPVPASGAGFKHEVLLRGYNFAGRRAYAINDTIFHGSSELSGVVPDDTNFSVTYGIVL